MPRLIDAEQLVQALAKLPHGSGFADDALFLRGSVYRQQQVLDVIAVAERINADIVVKHEEARISEADARARAPDWERERRPN